MSTRPHSGLEVDDSTVQASDVAWVDGLRPTDFVAGSDARAEKFCDGVNVGGWGVQAGTLFALSEESGMSDHTKQRILSELAEGDLSVFTDPVASPTGFPFKVLELKGTLSDKEK